MRHPIFYCALLETRSCIVCYVVSGCCQWGTQSQESTIILRYLEVFLDYNLYPKMNCDILIFSDLKNVLFALEMCLSLILTTITYMEWMWIVRKVLVHVWCFYRYHLAFLPQSQLILQRIPNNICYAYTVWSDKHCYLSSWIFPYFI